MIPFQFLQILKFSMAEMRLLFDYEIEIVRKTDFCRKEKSSQILGTSNCVFLAWVPANLKSIDPFVFTLETFFISSRITKVSFPQQNSSRQSLGNPPSRPSRSFGRRLKRTTLRRCRRQKQIQEHFSGTRRVSYNVVNVIQHSETFSKHRTRAGYKTLRGANRKSNTVVY